MTSVSGVIIFFGGLVSSRQWSLDLWATQINTDHCDRPNLPARPELILNSAFFSFLSLFFFKVTKKPSILGYVIKYFSPNISSDILPVVIGSDFEKSAGLGYISSAFISSM